MTMNTNNNRISNQTTVSGKALRCSAPQVGPVWGQGGSEEGATIQIALTAPGSVGIPTPYTLTYSGGAPILSAGTWDWDAYVTPGGQAGTPHMHACTCRELLQCSRRPGMHPAHARTRMHAPAVSCPGGCACQVRRSSVSS